MSTIIRKAKRLTVAMLCLGLIGLCLHTVSCVKQENAEMLQYMKTELGGCNLKNSPDSDNSDTEKGGDSDMGNDTVIITFSNDLVNVFVGINYICCAPFTTSYEMVDDIIVLYVTDTCRNPYEECYCKCMCYYTFDFAFKYQGEVSQKYKILLIDPRKEESILISEGIITNSIKEN